MSNGNYYIEVAHIKPVSKGGQSIIGNLLVLCPNHHKAFDYGKLQIIEQDESHLKGVLNNEQFEIKIRNGW
jgi:predicted restriction endonuclease